MKKYDFSPSTAQWRAKKLRERGSSTARPTEKGGGGLPIGARFGRFRSVDSVDFGRFRRDLRTSSWRFGRFGASILSIRSIRRVDSVAIRSIRRVDSVDFVAICGLHLGVSVDFGASRRFGASKSRRKHKKSPIPQSGNRAVAIARRRALLTFR